jgi:excisionase family DNA binding protein
MATQSHTNSIVADGLMTVLEAAQFLHVTRSTIYVLMDDRRELSYVRIGRARRIPKRALIAFAERNLVGSKSI